MGFLQSLKRTFNIGGARLAVTIASETHRQGDTIEGAVDVAGGEYAIEGRTLSLELVEFWTETRGSGKRRRRVTVTRTAWSTTLARPISLAAGDSASFRFAAPLPREARLSAGDEGWKLVVAMDVPGALDPHDELRLDVGIGADKEALIAALATLGFAQQRQRWTRAAGATVLRFAPPEELRPELDFVDAACRSDDDGMDVSLAFDLQERSLGDWLKAVFNLDQVKRSLRLHAADLDGSRAANARLGKLFLERLESALAERRRG